MLGDDLLTELAPLVGRTDLAYAEPPQLLTGGFFTENHRFRLTGAPSPWDRTLVLRLFPVSVPDDIVQLEATVQGGVAAAGFPTPDVVHFDPSARLDGRRYFVMDYVSGAPMLGGISIGVLLRQGPRLLRRLSHTTADVQVQLHQVDPAPILAELGDVSVRVERWFDVLEDAIDAGATGFEAARRWLVDNRPPERGPLVICHGDLHPGNLLVDDHGRVLAVLDWTVATLAEPVFELGFTSMALSLAPIDAPPWVQRLVRRFGRGIARRYVRAYTDRSPVDLTTLPYYEALRCAMEVSNAARWRLIAADGRGHELLRPTWDSIAGVMVDYFRARTGVEITLPPPVSA
jgi:aminoglycoside phosphotransferase (APT) family kinase protein